MYVKYEKSSNYTEWYCHSWTKCTTTTTCATQKLLPSLNYFDKFYSTLPHTAAIMVKQKDHYFLFHYSTFGACHLCVRNTKPFEWRLHAYACFEANSLHNMLRMQINDSRVPFIEARTHIHSQLLVLYVLKDTNSLVVLKCVVWQQLQAHDLNWAP